MTRLSVVVPTVQPWPRVRAVLEPLRDQAAGVGAEVLVLDGHGAGLPAEPLDAPFVPVSLPGSDVFELRAAAVPRARGELVALLEDHILVPPDWCDRIVEAFGDHPEADGLVGGVGNGAPHVLDRASFLVTWAPFLAPRREVPADRCPPPGVVAYRRRVLPTDGVAPGWLEYELPVRLMEAGRLVPCDRVTVSHVQYLGARGFSIQYHAGRAFGALECAGLPWPDRIDRLRVLARNPERVWHQTRRALASRPELRETRTCTAAIALMIGCNGLGQVVGALTGSPGSSPRHLE